MPLDGLRGHRGLYQGLASELRRRPSHAYLFSGPRGVGKSLVAQGLVHGLVCERSPGVDFCCTPSRCPVRAGASGAAPTARGRAEAAGRSCDCCPGCVQSALGVHPDVFHVRRSANRTDVLIEQVREMIARLGLKPARASMRAAVLDDAETLNVPAQNALLKTLEEPPGHTLLFVVSASERALLDTVRSRLRSVRFGPLSPADLEAILRARATSGGSGTGAAEQADMSAAVRLARGSAARAIALAEGEIPPADALLRALEQAGSLDFASACALAQEHFANRGQAAENFELIARLLEEILSYKLLGTDFLTAPAETAAVMRKLAASLGVEALANSIGAAVRASSAIEAMANPRLQAEQFWVFLGQAARDK